MMNGKLERATRKRKVYLEEAAPEDGDPAGAVEIHQLEDVRPTLSTSPQSAQLFGL